MKYLGALLVALIILLAVAIDQAIKWDNACEDHGGTAYTEEVGEVNGVPIVNAWCEGPDGERLEW